MTVRIQQLLRNVPLGLLLWEGSVRSQKLEKANTQICSFGGDATKCDRLNQLLCLKSGFTACYVSRFSVSLALVKLFGLLLCGQLLFA